MGEELITVQECAKRLRVSTSKIYQLTASGRIPCYRVGRRVLFSPDRHLGEWLKASEDPQGDRRRQS